MSWQRTEDTAEELYNRFMFCRKVGRTVEREIAKSALFYLRYGRTVEFLELVGVFKSGVIEEAIEAACFEAALSVAEEMGILCEEVVEKTYGIFLEHG